MIEDSQSKIEGSTVIGLGDQLRVFYNSSSMYLRFVVLPLLIFVVFGTIEFTLGDGDLSSTILISMAVVTVASTITFISIALGFFRLSESQRSVLWEIDKEAIVVKDQTGSILSIPWSQVRKAEESKNSFVLFCKPSGARLLPKRAFDAEGISQIRMFVNSLIN